MYGIGVYLRRPDLSPQEFAAGVVRAVTAILGSLLLATVGYEFARVQHISQLHGTMQLILVFALLSLFLRFFLTRWLATHHGGQ